MKSKPATTKVKLAPAGAQVKRCGICGERLRPSDELGEFYSDAWAPDEPSVIAHADCGLAHGYSVA